MSKNKKDKDLLEYIELIRKRYSPSVFAQDQLPSGIIAHHKDCDYSTVHICTCGLLKHLLRLTDRARAPEFYPPFRGEALRHVHVQQFLKENIYEIERAVAHAQAIMARSAQALDQGSRPPLPPKTLWRLRSVENDIEQMFYEAASLRDQEDVFYLLGTFKMLFYNVYAVVHRHSLKELDRPTVDLTSKGDPCLLWLAQDSTILKIFLDLEDNQYWLQLTEMLGNPTRSKVYDKERDLLEMLAEFLKKPYLA